MNKKVLYRIFAIFITLILLLIILSSCTGDYSQINDNTLYPAEMTVSGNYIWYTNSNVINSVQFYDFVNNTDGSLCGDSLCDHMNEDCVLYMKMVMEIIVDDNIIYMLLLETETNEWGYYCYDLTSQKMTEIYVFEDGYNSPCWCISNNELFFKLIENDDSETYKENIYKIAADGSENMPVSMQLEYNDPIYSFWVDNGEVYYIDEGVLKRNGETVLSDLYKLEFTVSDGYIYFSKNVREPDWHEFEDPERVKGANWIYDLYRIPVDGNEEDAELIISDVYDRVLINEQVVYYLPYNMYFAFSYPMPGAEEMERVFWYDMSSGAIAKYDLDSGKNKILFDNTKIIILEILGAVEQGIVVEGIDYCNVQVEGDIKNANKSDYYDNNGYYIISYDGKNIKRIETD